jgi:acyl-CoA thioester hydrolase
MSKPRTLLHETTLDTRWGDMDALGHINNATYFTYCESIRVEWLEGVSGRIAGAQGEGPVLINANCDFLRSIVHPARLQISMYGLAPGRSSVMTEYEIRNAADTDILYATGSAKVVWVDFSAGRSRPLPDSLRALLPDPD